MVYGTHWRYWPIHVQIYGSSGSIFWFIDSWSFAQIRQWSYRASKRCFSMLEGTLLLRNVKTSKMLFQERFALMMCSREMSSERATNGPCAKEAYFFERCQTYKSDTDVSYCFLFSFLILFRCTETRKLSTLTSISAIWQISTTRRLSRTILVGTSSASRARKEEFLTQTTSHSVTSKTKIKNKLLSFCSTLIYLQLLDSWKYKNETII